MRSSYQMYINGTWQDSADGSWFDDFNPYTGELLTTVANGSQLDALLAVNAAADAFPDWAAVAPSQKRLLFLKAADLLEKRKDELIDLLARETGAARPFAAYQAAAGPNYLREAGSQAHRVTGTILPSETTKVSMAMRHPVGVVAGISPWNCPVVLSLRAVCFAIAYGNTVVLKPSEESPLSGGVLLAELFEEAGFPRGVVNVVTHGYGSSNQIGDLFIQDRRVKRISFTGSTRVGRELAEKCGRQLKRIALELGGNDPLIVLKDADIDHAVNAAVFGRFLHQGQVCMNAKRLIIEKTVAQEFTAKFVARAAALKVGNPLDAATVIGPLINRKQYEMLDSQVTQAVAEGAQLLCGGYGDGLCYQPTVLGSVREDMAIFHEETFGPVASIIVAEDADQAVRMANNSTYGLSAGILTNNMQQGLALARRIESGACHVNDSPLYGETHAPLGGVNNSGWGKFGIEAMQEFTELQWVTLEMGTRQYPF